MMDAMPDPAALVRLDGKVALITGAASGIGRAQARLFAAAGASVIAVDRNADGLASLVAEMRPEGAVRSVVGDLSTADGVAAIVGAVSAMVPAVDILCNTAGYLDGFAPSLAIDEDLWERVFAINVTAVFRLTNAFLPAMLEKGEGVIINMASVASLITGGGGAAYTASKHAVLGYTRQVSADYGRKGIRANAICPGMIETGMTQDVLQNPKLVKAVSNVPAGRIGRPEDIAAVSLFLAGTGAGFVHGAAMVADGGLTIR